MTEQNPTYSHSRPQHPVSRERMITSDWSRHDLSWTDPVGQLFWHGKDLFRGIRAERADFYRDLFKRNIIQDLIEKKLLVETWVTDNSTEEFPLILQHRVLPTVTFASEWCEVSFKRAAVLILDLEIALRKNGLTLMDINPWNMLLDGAAPLYVDFCSISPLADKSRWAASEQYERFFLNPVTLHSKGLSRTARRLLYDPWNGVSPQEMRRMGLAKRSASPLRQRLPGLVKNAVPKSFYPVAKKIRDAFFSEKPGTVSRGDATAWVTSLRDYVLKMPLSGVPTDWAGYYNNNFPALDDKSQWTTKHHAISNIIDDKKPASLLDVGANRGWYSQLAAHKGVQAIATDSDDTSINELAADIEAKGLNVIPLYMDIRFPEAAQGPAYGFFSPASKRLKSEMVLALAVVHHLAFTWHLNFDQIIENFSMFTTRWLVVEFVGPQDAVVMRDWNAADRPWYSLQNFLEALEKHFTVERITESDSGGLDYRGDDRTLILCSKKS